MNSFNRAMERVGTEKKTLNNSKTYSSSLSKCLDLFALGGSIRYWVENDVETLFNEAYKESPVVATKIALYIRDVRNGMGERKIGRVFLSLIASKLDVGDDMILKIISHISEIGRWDDLVHIFYNTKNEDLRNSIGRIIRTTLMEDNKSDNPSLLAKWLPSINAGKLARKQAVELLCHLGLSPKNYRKVLSSLRKRIDIVETKVTKQKFYSIDYSKVPSQALMRYSNIFYEKDSGRFSDYIKEVKSGNKKMNTKTLYPYQIIEPFLRSKMMWHSGVSLGKTEEDFYNTAWENLPDYTKGSKAIVMADTSGSMYLSNYDPLTIALSLAIYFAEKNSGPFKDKFMTFSHKPTFQIIKGDTLGQKVSNLDMSGWSQNTDLNKAFELVLKTGIDYNVPQEDMPEAIYIISDMEFDVATSSSNNNLYRRNPVAIEETNFEAIEKLYSEAGYQIPTIVFWNVRALNQTIPVRYDEHGTILVSGKSSIAFSNAVEKTSPHDFMMRVISNRYLFVE